MELFLQRARRRSGSLRQYRQVTDSGYPSSVSFYFPDARPDSSPYGYPYNPNWEWTEQCNNEKLRNKTPESCGIIVTVSGMADNLLSCSVTSQCICNIFRTYAIGKIIGVHIEWSDYLQGIAICAINTVEIHDSAVSQNGHQPIVSLVECYVKDIAVNMMPSVRKRMSFP